jgi:hypothetical protein
MKIDQLNSASILNSKQTMKMGQRKLRAMGCSFIYWIFG